MYCADLGCNARVSDHRGSIIKEPCTVLDQNYKNDSIVSVDMDKVGVMAAYSDPLLVCRYNGSQHAAITRTLSMSTDTIESFL